MSRGPVPAMARDESLLIAARRGVVHSHVHRRGNVCDLSIISPGLVAFVCAMRLITLSSTLSDILHDFAAVIGRLRFIASSLAISRELWLRTPRGVWRFFRILDDTIIELDRYGMPLANVVTPAGAGAASGIVITVPAPRLSPAAAGNDPGSGAGKTGVKNILAGPDREQIRERVPASGLSHGAGPKSGPSPGSGVAGPVPENADTAGAGPDQGTAVADHKEKPYEPDMSQYPGVSLELVRRFTRWREAKRGKGTGSG